MSDPDRDEIVIALRKLPSASFAMSVQIGDEPSALVRQLGSVLEQSGWTWKDSGQDGIAININGHKVTLMTSASKVIVEYDFTKDQQWGASIKALVDQLSRNGTNVRANRVTAGGIDPELVQIYVGERL